MEVWGKDQVGLFLENGREESRTVGMIEQGSTRQLTMLVQATVPGVVVAVVDGALGQRLPEGSTAHETWAEARAARTARTRRASAARMRGGAERGSEQTKRASRLNLAGTLREVSPCAITVRRA